MSQVTSLSVANGGGSAVRAAINLELAALFSANSGAAAPSPTVGGMIWLDTGVSPPVLRVRNTANTGWIALSPETIAANSLWGNPTGAAGPLALVSMSQLKTMLGFSQSLGASGWAIQPSGLVLQWGVTGTILQGSTAAVTFPMAFPTACDRVICSPNSSGANTAGYTTSAISYSTTGFTATNNSGISGATTATWFAVGR